MRDVGDKMCAVEIKCGGGILVVYHCGPLLTIVLFFLLRQKKGRTFIDEEPDVLPPPIGCPAAGTSRSSTMLSTSEYSTARSTNAYIASSTSGDEDPVVAKNPVATSTVHAKHCCRCLILFAFLIQCRCRRARGKEVFFWGGGFKLGFKWTLDTMLSLHSHYEAMRVQWEVIVACTRF